MKKYFHELPQSEIENLISENKTIEYLVENYKQPDWCCLMEALSMNAGCWSLCDVREGGLRTKISKDFCKECDYFEDNN